jgi:hypothetical protein
MDAPRPPDDNAPVDATPFVGIVGALPGPPRRIRVGRYADLLRTLGLVDPVPASFRFVCAAAWRALAEGVERVDVASSVEALLDVDEALVVCGVAAPPQSPQKAERLWLFDAPEPPAPAGTVPPGMTGLWPWVRLVLPGLPAPVALPPSVLAAGLFATGRVASTYAAEPVPSVVTPSGPDWVRLTPMGRRRVLGLDPPPARPGAVPQFGPGAASDWWRKATAASCDDRCGCRTGGASQSQSTHRETRSPAPRERSAACLDRRNAVLRLKQLLNACLPEMMWNSGGRS